MRRLALIAVSALLGAAVIAGCGAMTKVPPPAAGSPPPGSVVVRAAGGDLGAPVYQELASLIAPDGITLNYQLSRAPQLVAGNGPSGVPLVAAVGATDIEQSLAQQGEAYVPVGFGAVAVVYHLRGVRSLKLSAQVLAGIFSGHISSWNASAISRSNPGVRLPRRPIMLVHLPNRSLLTRLLSRYLAMGSPAWRRAVGHRVKIRWPGGTPVANEADMAAVVAETQGAIGYLSASTAAGDDLPTAALGNRAGRFVRPTLAATAKVGDQRDPGGQLSFPTIDAKVRSAYPVAAELYVVTYSTICASGAALKRDGRAVARTLAYLTGPSGQALISQMSFAPLPTRLRHRAQAAVERLGCGSQAL